MALWAVHAAHSANKDPSEIQTPNLGIRSEDTLSAKAQD